MRSMVLGLLMGLMASPGLVCGQAVPPAKLTASLARLFGEGVRAESLSVDGEGVLRISRGDQLLGFAQVRNVKGKDQPITYLVAVDTALTLLDVDILVYREAYGGEVAYEPWRRQFRGKHPGDTLEVGRQIRGISGATISVNAVTAGVRQALARFASWHAAGRL
jgi:hypothetical protein